MNLDERKILEYETHLGEFRFNRLEDSKQVPAMGALEVAEFHHGDSCIRRPSRWNAGKMELGEIWCKGIRTEVANLAAKHITAILGDIDRAGLRLPFLVGDLDVDLISVRELRWP